MYCQGLKVKVKQLYGQREVFRIERFKAYIAFFTIQRRKTTEVRRKKPKKCTKIYFDIGANIGMHSRFIFESEKFNVANIYEHARLDNDNTWLRKMGGKLGKMYEYERLKSINLFDR